MYESIESTLNELEPEENARTCRDCVNINPYALPLPSRTACKLWAILIAIGQIFIQPLVFGNFENRVMIGILWVCLISWALVCFWLLHIYWLRNIRGGRYFLSLDRLCPVDACDPNEKYDPPKLHIHRNESHRYLCCGGGPLFFVSNMSPIHGSTIDRPMEGMILEVAWGWSKRCQLYGCRSKYWPRVEVQWPKLFGQWTMLTIWDENGETHTMRFIQVESSSVFVLDYELVPLLRILASHDNWRSVLRGAVKYNDAKSQEPPAVAMDAGGHRLNMDDIDLGELLDSEEGGHEQEGNGVTRNIGIVIS